jgi:hypothetical protein
MLPGVLPDCGKIPHASSATIVIQEKNGVKLQHNHPSRMPTNRQHCPRKWGEILSGSRPISLQIKPHIYQIAYRVIWKTTPWKRPLLLIPPNSVAP